jgi:hypothetical protein
MELEVRKSVVKPRIDYLFLAREMMLLMMELQAEVGTLRLAVQKHGISLEELQACRAELERRFPLEQRRQTIRGVSQPDLLKSLREFQGPIQ